MRDFKLYLHDILKACYSIQIFVKGFTFEEFCGDDKTISAVLKKFEIIGEASAKIPDEIKDEFRNVPWKEMIAMRNILVHAYFGTENKIIWDAIFISVPDLISQIENILQKYNH